MYAIEAELVPWLGMVPQINLAHVEEARRRSAELVGQAPRYEPTVPVDIRDLRVPGPEGAPDVSIRLYTSRNGDGDPRPGLLYIHGGAFVTGNVPMFDNDCLRIAADVGAVVVSVEYRLAPEHRFPVGVEDCYAALTDAGGRDHHEIRVGSKIRLPLTRLLP